MTITQLADAASDARKGLQDTAGSAGLGTAPPELSVILGRVISAALGLVGFVFLVLMVVGGFMWMTASGDETKVDKARKILYSSIIGFIIIAAAYAITNFVFEQILKATGTGAS